ncbi:Uncharacterized protein FWK35_00017733 [Aphis craccivora]|uniref:Uncharacterized protein n=1 Tax=Aphis craccivora TaxID=307492 RepID=A0A6G0ZJ92_APHCR|nr:Uncharacterized protein FWK35_00017733 [Aphis craccivora]
MSIGKRKPSVHGCPKSARNEGIIITVIFVVIVRTQMRMFPRVGETKANYRATKRLWIVFSSSSSSSSSAAISFLSCARVSCPSARLQQCQTVKNVSVYVYIYYIYKYIIKNNTHECVIE